MKKIRVGVVGVGHIGKNHARLYGELPGANFVAIYDTDRSKASQLAAEFGVSAASSLEEFGREVDAASIATPTITHCEIGRGLLALGKHLLIEKPIAANTADATELVKLAADRRLILQVGHVERFNPILSALEKRLTNPRFIEAHRLSPYPNRSTDIGVVLDLMIHDLEIILHLVRAPVQMIDATGVPVLSRSEDIANARIRFENGCVANVTSSRISPEQMRKIRVFQEDTYLSLDYQNQSGEIYRRMPTGLTREEVEIEREEPLKRQLASFIECATTGRAPTVSGFEATAALELAVEITKQIDQGAAVSQPPFQPFDDSAR
jgi:predicted dehydrogenase